jgi:phospholipid/cholesterol/gamma-HCH transport system ATP-binding protein
LIIGQSGSGKTVLLKSLWEYILRIRTNMFWWSRVPELNPDENGILTELEWYFRKCFVWLRQLLRTWFSLKMFTKDNNAKIQERVDCV